MIGVDHQLAWADTDKMQASKQQCVIPVIFFLQPNDTMNFFLLFSLLAFIITADAQLNCSREPDELQFLFMASNGSSFNSYSSLVGVDMALERINGNSSLLPNFTLSYSDVVDTQV